MHIYVCGESEAGACHTKYAKHISSYAPRHHEQRPHFGDVDVADADGDAFLGELAGATPNPCGIEMVWVRACELLCVPDACQMPVRRRGCRMCVMFRMCECGARMDAVAFLGRAGQGAFVCVCVCDAEIGPRTYICMFYLIG